jgi:hypothetical protein
MKDRIILLTYQEDWESLPFNDSPIWLLSDQRSLPTWILGQKVNNDSGFKPFHEFNHEYEAKNVHFMDSTPISGQQNSATTVEFRPLNGHLWDSSNRTLLTGWSIRTDWEIIVADFKVSVGDGLHQSDQVLLLAPRLSEMYLPIALLEPNEPLAKMASQTLENDKSLQDELKRPGSLRAWNKLLAEWTENYLEKLDAGHLHTRRTRLLKLSNGYWQITIVDDGKNPRIVPGISNTQRVRCIDLEIIPASQLAS